MKKIVFLFLLLSSSVLLHASESGFIPENIKKWILEIIQKLGTSALGLILSVLGVKSNLLEINTRDGQTLKALFFPAQSDSLFNSQNKPPLIIAITSWGLPDFEYILNSVHLAKKGYNVVSYCARGFWNSGDEIHLAGPQDVADVSDAIDWAEKNTNSDVER
jgi:predicted acyl esterase